MVVTGALVESSTCGGHETTKLQAADGSSAGPRHTVLDFSNAYFGDDKCGDIVDAVRRAGAAPVQLDLRGNRFEAAGAKALAAMLRGQHSVVSLCLEWNNVGLLDEGVVALAAALEVDSRLLELDLRNNNIGSEGAKALAAALRRNRTLRKLDLRWNEIGNAGVLAFVETLQSNHALLTLEITGNNSSFKHAEEIERLLTRNRSIQGQQRLEMQQEQTLDEPRNQPPSPRTEEISHHQSDQLLVQVLGEKEALETDLQIAKRHNAKLVEKVEECELQIQLVRKENESVKNDRDRYQQREIDARAEAHEVRMRLEELENRRRVEFEEYRTARAALEREATVLRDKLSHAETLHQKSDDQKAKQIAQLEEIKYKLESDVHRLELSAGSQEEEFQKLRKELLDACKDHERKLQSSQASHKAELSSASRQWELSESSLRSQLAYTTEQLDDAKRSLSALKDKHDELQTLVVQERVTHERLVHELTRQHETESQHRLQKSMQAVEAQVEEIKKSRQFLEREVERHLDAVVRLRQENLSLQQASDERLQSLQQEFDRQYKELQDKQDQLRDAHKETAKATEKCQQIQRRVEEQDRVMCRLKEGYEERLRELSIAAEAAASHHRATMETKTEVIARLESQLLRADRLLSQQIHAYEERFDGFADAMAAFLQDQVKREHERRQPSQANPTKEEAKAPETGSIVYG